MSFFSRNNASSRCEVIHCPDVRYASRQQPSATGPAAAVPTDYTLGINNRHRGSREQTALRSIHPSIDQTSHALQSALIVCVHLTERSSISSRAEHVLWSVPVIS